MKKIYCTISLLFILATVFSQNTYYVNDNSTANDAFTTSTGNDANAGTAALPFATIQHAADVATAGSVIYVDAGLYFEQVTLNKGLSLIGVNSGVTIVLKPAVINPPPGPFTEAGTIQSAQNIGDVHIRDMSITGDDNGVTPIILQTGGSVKNCRLINGNQGIYFRVDPAIKTAVIENNYISVQYIGINCQGSGLTATLTNNTIDMQNPFFAAGVFAGLDFGPLVRFTAFGNAINNYNAQGIIGNSYNTNITQNSIIGTGQHAIEQSTNSLAFATCNWFGTTNASVIASKVSGLFSYTPYLTNGTNTNTTYGNYSFVPVPGACGEGINNFYVNDNSRSNDVFTTAEGSNTNAGTSVAPFATLSYAIAVAPPNSVIHVDAGTYAEQVIIDKGIVINGAGRNLTSFIKPAVALVPAPGPFTEIGLIETTAGIGDVHIRNISVNSIDGSSQNIIIQSGGSVKNCSLLNGGQGVFFRVEPAVKNAVIENNIIFNPFIGVNCQGSHLTATIQNNFISGNSGILSGVFAGLDFGPLPQLTITNNTISNYGLFGGSGMTVNSNNGNYNSNSITGTGSFAIERNSGNTPNATCNWFGTTNAATVASKINGAINYTPYLTNGTDNDPAGGFQPVPNSCNGLPPTIVLNNFSDVNCNGGNNGAINITTTNGKAPFTYTWTKEGDPAFVSHAEDPTDLKAGTYHLAVVDGNGSTIYVGANGVATHIQVTITQPAALTATATGTNNLCNGNTAGTATVLAGGGTAPYTYLWSNNQTTAGISNLAAAIYSVTVTDAKGCTANATYEVTQPAILTTAAGGTNVSCFGGNNATANVLATGGTAPYTYLWSNNQTTAGISNLVAAIYTVTVTDANGCIANATYEVTQPAVLTASATGTNNLCHGNTSGTATAIAGGGTAPYTYLWSNNQTTTSISNLAAGIFTVTVTDANGCTANAAYEVTEPSTLTATASGTNVSCFGGNNGTANVLAAGGVSSYTYLWNNSATGSAINTLTAATYAVTVTDANGCTANANYTVTQPSPLAVTVTGTTASCNGTATANVTGGTSPYTYLWNNGATTAAVSNVPAGVYTVTVKDAHNCTVSGSFTITGNSPINPTATVVNVSCFGGSTGSITVTGAGGTAPRTYNLNGSAFQPNNIFNNLPAGTYVVGVKDANGCSDFVTKIITQPALLVVVLDSMRKTCSGVSDGRIYITASGGTGAKTYSWTGPNGYTSATQDPNNIATGVYSVVVTDSKGCTATLGVTLATWPAININEVVTNVGCRGESTGAINANVSGGTGSGFIYAWNGPGTIVLPATANINGLRAGNYILSVTDAVSGCIVQKTIVVTQPATLVNVTATNPPNITVCGGSTLFTATGSGGTAPYEFNLDGGAYQATNTFTIYSAGVHSITIRDANGCTKTISKTVTDNGSDLYEPNNTKSAAKTVSPGATNDARIALATDLADWFKFTTANAGTYTIAVNHPSISYVFNVYSGANNSPALIPLNATATTKDYNLGSNTTYYIQLTGGLSYSCYSLSVYQGTLPIANMITTGTAKEVPALQIANFVQATIYPNPHTGTFNMQISSPEAAKATIQIITVEGKIIISKDIRLQKGNSNVLEFKDIYQPILFYRLTVNNRTISGKILGPN